MDYDAFKSWLKAYGSAWEATDPRAAAELFSEEATYQETPFSEPLRGRAAIFDYWSHVARSQEQIRFGFDILTVTEDSGIAHWWASFLRIPSRTRVKLDGIFVISLDGENRCKALKEWWQKQEKKSE